MFANLGPFFAAAALCALVVSPMLAVMAAAVLAYLPMFGAAQRHPLQRNPRSIFETRRAGLL